MDIDIDINYLLFYFSFNISERIELHIYCL